MELDENSLYRLIEKVIKQLSAEENRAGKTTLYAVLPELRWDGCRTFFRGIGGQYRIVTVVTGAAAEKEPLQSLIRSGGCGTILKREEGFQPPFSWNLGVPRGFPRSSGQDRTWHQ